MAWLSDDSIESAPRPVPPPTIVVMPDAIASSTCRGLMK